MLLKRIYTGVVGQSKPTPAPTYKTTRRLRYTTIAAWAWILLFPIIIGFLPDPDTLPEQVLTASDYVFLTTIGTWLLIRFLLMPYYLFRDARQVVAQSEWHPNRFFLGVLGALFPRSTVTYYLYRREQELSPGGVDITDPHIDPENAFESRWYLVIAATILAELALYGLGNLAGVLPVLPEPLEYELTFIILGVLGTWLILRLFILPVAVNRDINAVRDSGCDWNPSKVYILGVWVLTVLVGSIYLLQRRSAVQSYTAEPEASHAEQADTDDDSP